MIRLSLWQIAIQYWGLRMTRKRLDSLDVLRHCTRPRLWVRCGLLVGLHFMSVQAWAADALDQKISLNIPPTTLLEDALIQWGTAAGMTVMINTSTLKDRFTSGVSGTLTARQALMKLLQDSGLSFSEESGNILVIRSTGYIHSSKLTDLTSLPPGFSASSIEDGPGSTSSDDSSASSTGTSREDLDEVVVSAEKRIERLQDVPVPVSLVNSESLAENGQVKLQDYFSSVPGLNVAPPSEHPTQVLSIRGITTGEGSNPTVGISVDDVPYGASTNLGGGSVIPDIDPGDLARVEILRGPQGTLYGASSMGGLIKFVTVDPSTASISGRVQASVSGVQQGAEPGFGVRAAINVPLGSDLAVRISAFSRQDPGFINNPMTHEDGVNEAHANGGRVSLLWKPTDILSWKLSALFQETKADGQNEVDILPGLRGLEQNYIPGVGGNSVESQAYSSVFTAALGTLTLTAVSGYNINSFTDSNDYTYALGSTTQRLFGVSGAPTIDNNKTKKFSQELRLSATLGANLDFLLGGFYTHEDSDLVQGNLAEDTTTGRDIAQTFAVNVPSTYQEYAAFSDLTFHFNDKFDVQVGGRESHISQTFNEVESGPLLPDLFLVP